MVFHREVDHDWPPFQEWHSHDPQFRLVRTGVFASSSPIGDRLLCNDRTAGNLHNSILMMNSDGSQRSVLFSDAEKSALGPVWSPQGDKIAFAFGQFFQSINGPAVSDIAVMHSDGTGLKILTDGSGNYGFPSWSPDGRYIVYRSSGKDKNNLSIINVETSEVRALTTGSNNDNFPSWSPMGDRISFTSYRDGDYEIYTIKRDGTDVRRLTDISGNDAHNTWSPDGKWIVFTSARGGFKDEAVLHPYNPQPYGDIYVMRADGSDVRMLTDNQFEEGTPSWIPIRQK
jgi:Tol biopolymer transport system component